MTKTARRRGSVTRRSDILAAVSTLIRQRGYINVTMNAVADAVQVTAPALYRHFANKQEMLATAISDGLAVAEGVALDARHAGASATIAALARASADQRISGCSSTAKRGTCLSTREQS